MLPASVTKATILHGVSCRKMVVLEKVITSSHKRRDEINRCIICVVSTFVVLVNLILIRFFKICFTEMSGRMLAAYSLNTEKTLNEEISRPACSRFNFYITN
jgi:hypothetical protein